jgi:hypothetical protein
MERAIPGHLGLWSEVAADALAARTGEGAGESTVVENSREGRGESLGVSGRYEQAVTAGTHHVGDAARGRSHHGAPAGHRLEHRVRQPVAQRRMDEHVHERIDRRQEMRLAAGQDGAVHLGVLPPEDLEGAQVVRPHPAHREQGDRARSREHG